MADDTQVQKLLDEIFDSERTPEEVCRAYPELLPEVRQRWQQMRLVEAELDVLFPTPTPNQADTPAPWYAGAALPRLPGYEVEAVIGRGGMGIVYRASDLRLHRLVAVKMLLAGAFAGTEEHERFLREAEALAGLRHANIVQIYGVGDHCGRPYFTMEYVEGGSLAQRIAGTPQPARQAAALLATLAEAVGVAHQGGIVHRDLKPGNILLAPAVGEETLEGTQPPSSYGTPKIADFGLARHFDGGPALTLSGARLGTPSYMAPEQVLGEAQTIGPAADIYALGAILYEMLTGRPPFRSETATETERQVLTEEPVPPSRLNAKVPRDLETICLTCLHKNPQRRYATAAALADDLHRFQQRKPIAARPVGLLERTGKWVRRHPTVSALLATSLLMTAALLSMSWWLVAQQAHERDAVEADLKEVAQLQEQARWREAGAALDRADARFGGVGSNDLRQRLGQARRDLGLVMRLDDIRLRRVTRGELVFYKGQANQAYVDAFREAGLGTIQDDPAHVAARVKASAVRPALAAALDDWAVCSDKDHRDWLLDVARQANPDASGWRDRILDPKTWDDPVALADLARTVPAEGPPVSLLLALAERLKAVGGDWEPLLRRVQKEYPADFWANLVLGNAVLQRQPWEAGGFYRAALTSRPGDAVGYCAVGDALRLQNLLADAADYYQKAIQRDTQYARAHSNLGLVLQERGRMDEAMDCYQRAVELDPDYAWPQHNLANALRLKGRLDEAHEHSQKALQLDPGNIEARKCLINILIHKGRAQEALDDWRKVLQADNPTDPEAWYGYAELYLFLGHEEEYRRVRSDLLKRFGDDPSPYHAEPLGRCCLLLPATEDELRRAVALIDRAVAAKETPPKIYRYFLFAKGLAEYRQGHLASAISMMKGEASTVMGPSPRLIVAMAQHRQGQKTQARKTLAQAVSAFDWRASRADRREAWIFHILRREAEALILPDLPAFLAGKYQPQDNDERLALMGVCQFQGLDGVAAQMYAEAFASDPTLADDLKAEYRYRAARCAAQAGCNRSKDAAALGETERARWRKQARIWLQADLAARARMLTGASTPTRGQVRQMLARWQTTPDLAGLRDTNAVEKLSVEEKKECLALWDEVAGVLRRAETLPP
jgi:serine/threonine-protein kinase